MEKYTLTREDLEKAMEEIAEEAFYEMNELDTPKEVKEAADNARTFIKMLGLEQDNYRWAQDDPEDIDRGMVGFIEVKEDGTKGFRVAAYNIMSEYCTYKYDQDDYWDFNETDKELQKTLDNYKKKEFEKRCDNLQTAVENKTIAEKINKKHVHHNKKDSWRGGR